MIEANARLVLVWAKDLIPTMTQAQAGECYRIILPLEQEVAEQAFKDAAAKGEWFNVAAFIACIPRSGETAAQRSDRMAGEWRQWQARRRAEDAAALSWLDSLPDDEAEARRMDAVGTYPEVLQVRMADNSPRKSNGLLLCMFKRRDRKVQIPETAGAV